MDNNTQHQLIVQLKRIADSLDKIQEQNKVIIESFDKSKPYINDKDMYVKPAPPPSVEYVRYG